MITFWKGGESGMAVKVVLENAKAQLEQQKAREFEVAKQAKMTELASEFNTFKAAKEKEYTDSISALKTAYDAAVLAKKQAYDEVVKTKQTEINKQAEEYATGKAAVLEGLIAELQIMIEKTEG